jgi:hypothetical protein
MDLDSAGQWLAVMGALGAASYGLVDVAKAFWGGPSRVGFAGIHRVVCELLGPDGSGGKCLLTNAVLLNSLKSNWINGAPFDHQKELAKSFIRERLSETSAPALAERLGIDPAELTAIGKARDEGDDLSAEQQAVYEKFDFALSVVIDAAYQRADQAYRNFSKLLATLIGVVLAGIGGHLFHADIAVSLLVGLLAAPFAPISKDLASTLQALAKVLNPPKKLP